MSEGIKYDFIDRMESPGNTVTKNCDFIISQADQESIYDLDMFSDVFSKEDIQQDKIYVSKIESQWRAKTLLVPKKERENMSCSKKRSEALEIIISDQIELNNWFGQDALFYKTTQYDDIVNGTDAVVEFTTEDKPERLSLAIDSTSNTNQSKVKEKIDRNIAKVLNNSLEIKYFKSQVNDDKGILKGVIPVVIGLEAKNTNSLINDFAQIIRLKQTSESNSIADAHKASSKKEYLILRNKMVSNPVQLIFLEEIKMQLDMYQSILASENNPNVFVQQTDISRLSQIIEDIINSKGEINKNPDTKIFRNDTVYNLIGYESKKKHNIPPKN